MQPAIAKFGTAAIEMVLNRMTVGIAMGFRPKGFVSEGGNQVRVEMRRGVRRDEYPHLLRQVSDAEGFGKTRVSGRIELHKRQGARFQKLANGKPVPLALAMR